MNNTAEYIGKQFSSVYITFLSILIGLALEDWVSAIRSQTNLFDSSVTSLIILLQFAQNLVMIIVSWVTYCQFAMARKSVPTPMEAVHLLLFALTLFALNTFIGESYVYYNYAFFAFFVLGGYSTYYSVEKLGLQDTRYRRFTDIMQSKRGPLLAHAFGAVYCIVFGIALEFDLITPAIYVFVVASATTFIAIWGVLVYLLWKKYIVEITT